MAVPNSLPRPIQAVLGGREVPILPCESVPSTDESVRRRRAYFGDQVFPTSVLVDHGAHFVIVRYAKHARPRGWTLPGGYAEPSETVEAAAAREVREECGLAIDRVRPVGVVTTTITSPTEGSLGYYLTIFRGRSIAGTLAPEDREEIDEVRLATFEQIEVLAAGGSFPSVNPHLDGAIVECLRRSM